MNRSVSYILGIFFIHSCFFSVLCAQQRILTIGDSTMADYDEEINSGEKEKRGWVQMLPLFLKEEVVLINAAKNGRSSKSFYYEFWKDLRSTIQPGDYIFIQFGHNDEKADGMDTSENDPTQRGTAAWGQYHKYLTLYVNDIKERGGYPILFTPIVRRLFNEDKRINDMGKHNLRKFAGNDSIMNYPLAMRSLARELNVPLVDMTQLTQNLVEEYGADNSRQIIYAKDDNTHLKAMGGILFSKLAVENLLEQGFMADYFLLPSELMIHPLHYTFREQPAGMESIKTFDLLGLDMEKEIDTIRINVNVPYSLSSDVSGPFSPEIELVCHSGNMYRPVFVRFAPEKEGVYEEILTVATSGTEQYIPLSGRSISLPDAQEFTLKWNPSFNKKPESGTLLDIKTSVSGLEGSGEENRQLLSPPGSHWPAGDIDINTSRYLELAVSSPLDMLYLTSFQFELGAIGGNEMECTILASADPSFSAPWSLLTMEKLPDNKTGSYQAETFIPLKKEEPLYIRIYPWYKKAAEQKFFFIKDVTIKGMFPERDPEGR
ncbi:MAG: rhamnogalacturonan acetylesterase [Candidatus Azobacteroides sp.]|nr:rhamnogalacturonan acetylesterase [Candidatus Azobacteroides sp.]